MTAGSAPLHICLRNTLDWGDEAAFRAQLDPAFASKVDARNSTFRLPYHQFRRELREIAQTNLERVEGAVLCSWDEVHPGGLGAPEVVGLHWRQSLLEVPINAGHHLRLLLRRLIPGLRPRWLCATNSYVIRRKGSVDPHCFASHVAASRWFPQLQPGQIRVLPERLSLHNRSLASITSLNYGRPSINPQQLRRRGRAYNHLYRGWHTVPPELAWSLPSLQRMEALMARLWLGGV